MSRFFTTVAASAVLALALSAKVLAADVNPTPAPQIDIKKVTCADLVGADLLDRMATIMFLWGYEAGKQNVTVFKPAQVKVSTRKVMTYCRSHLTMPLLDATEAALGIGASSK